MRFNAETRRSMNLALVALLAIAVVPSLVMIGCNMPMTDGACMGTPLGPTISAACGGVYKVVSTDLTSIVTSGFPALMFALFAAVAGTIVLLAPAAQQSRLVFAPVNPPPPPEDPLGVRLTL